MHFLERATAGGADRGLSNGSAAKADHHRPWAAGDARTATRRRAGTPARRPDHSFEQLAARLAGGLSRPVDDETLRATVQAALPGVALGELDSLKSLPGMVGALVDTLRKAWRAGVDLQARAGEHPRIASIASLEETFPCGLPPAMMRPVDLVAAGLQRLDHVDTLFGPIEIVGITELSPCWRPLLHAIAPRVPVRWTAGPRGIPAWLDGGAIDVARAEPHAPEIITVSASTAYHEAIEAVRWARQLIASGTDPAEIAIASVTPADYDDHFLALRADANLDLHFVHGVKITACREGQAAAALADILVRGLSQTRMRRLAALLAAYPGPFEALPAGWTRVLPADAPLASSRAWTHLLDRLTGRIGPRNRSWSGAARDHLSAVAGRIRGRSDWRSAAEWQGLGHLAKALLAGPAASLDLTLETLKQDDGLDACVPSHGCRPARLAASPRRFVRLLGLNSSRWPRGISEDRLLSDHIIPTAELDPLPVSAADRRDFATIFATSERQVVLSRARRDSDGRLLGRSTLLQGQPDEIYLRRNRIPDHAFSETDRLTARPQEFCALPQAPRPPPAGATGCGRRSPLMTASFAPTTR